jgi:dihydroorotate dehydrogenase
LTIKDVKPYVREINFIVDDYNNNPKYVKLNKDIYLNRINNIKSGLSNIKKPYAFDKYFKYKIMSIEKLQLVLENVNKDSSNINKYVQEYNKYNNLAQKEKEKILKSTFIRVTHFNVSSYHKREGANLQ